MSKYLFVAVTTAVTLAGQKVDIGEVLELPERSANALVKEGCAQIVEPTEETAKELQNTPQGNAGDPGTGDKGQEGTNTSEEVKTQTEGSQAPLTGSDNPTDDEVAQNAAADRELTAKALDAQYKLDDLGPKAKDAGVDFAYNATKKELIAAIIDQGKAAELLK